MFYKIEIILNVKFYILFFLNYIADISPCLITYPNHHFNGYSNIQ